MNRGSMLDLLGWVGGCALILAAPATCAAAETDENTVAAATSTTTSPEEPEDAPKQGFSVLLTLTTDYLWRGVSQTHRDPAFQPELDYDFPLNDDTAFYAGIWASNIKYPGFPNAKAELEYWAGLTREVGHGFSATLETLYYDYPAERKLSYGEVSMTAAQLLELPLKPTLSLAEAYAWDTYGTGTDSFYTDLSLKLELPAAFGFSAHYGRSRFIHEVADQDYSDWKLALTRTISGNDLELSYNDTNAKQYGRDGAGHWVFSLTHHF